MAEYERRLAAILAADVAGYSRLMELDEAGTLARFKLLRGDHFEPAIRSHGGRLVGEAGDSLLVEFQSVTAAVACAVVVQAKLAVLNAELPEDRPMRFRMGINLGEVIPDGATVHGDGVNVAARLEKLADPGGIFISRAVHDQIKGKLTLSFEDLGDKRLHNISEPVRVFRVGTDEPARVEAPKTRLRRPSKVVVLPFANMSGDGEQEHFADGITEDLITALAKAQQFSVVARNSAFLYKGRSAKVQDIGRELDARYVIEGSVRTARNRVRVTVQLIDADSGAHLWAERFDRDLSDIFVVQDEIVLAVALQLGFSLTDAAAADRSALSDAALTAYDHLLRARAAWRLGDPIKTRDHYLKAIEADASHAPALAGLAFLHAEDIYMQLFGIGVAEAMRIARQYAKRAIATHQGDPWVHRLIGQAFQNLGELDKAKHHLEVARKLNPFDPMITIHLGWLTACYGAHAEGLAMIERTFWLEPRLPPAIYSIPFDVHYMMRDYRAAIADFVRQDEPYAFHYLMLAACYAQLGEADQVSQAIAAFELQRPTTFDIPAFVLATARTCGVAEDQAHWIDGFRKAGLFA